MTKDEAIKTIEVIKCEAEWEYPLNWQLALDMAIEALQREVPKNPVINFISDADGSRWLNEGWKEDALLCPVCHTYFGEIFDQGYCRKCGHKLIQKRVRVIEE